VVSPPELRDEVAQAAVDLLRQHSATKNARK